MVCVFVIPLYVSFDFYGFFFFFFVFFYIRGACFLGAIKPL